MEDTRLSIKESQVIGRVIDGDTDSIKSTDINALIGGVLHATADVSTAVLNAVCEDKKLRSEMVSQLHTAVQATVDDDSENVRQLLSTNEANSEAIRSLIANMTNAEVADERLRMCFDELRYYDSLRQSIVTEQRQYKGEVLEKTVELEQRIVAKDSIVIPKAAIYKGINVVVQNPNTWKLLGKLIENLLR